MRCLIFFIATLFCANALLAQVNWLSPEHKWTFYATFGFAGPGIETLRPGTDTLMGGKTYTKMLRTVTFRSGNVLNDERLLRQEGRKVFAISQTEVVKREFLMYNFDLKTGDTVWMKPLSNASNFGYVVTSVGTVQVGNQPRIAQDIEWVYRPVPVKGSKGLIVEGIGSVLNTHLIGGADCLTASYFFIDEPSAAAVDGPERKFCTFESGGVAYDQIGNTFCMTLPAHSPLEATVNIWPSLSTGQVFVANADENDLLAVRLFDLRGRLIQQQEMRGSGSLQTEYKGTALLQVVSEKGRLTRKVVFF